MSYRHQFADGKDVELPVGKVVCVGRNYAEHAKELNNPIPVVPLLFMKPSTAIVSLNQWFTIPKHLGEVHYETELAVLIGQPLKNADEEEARESIAGIGLALDLTLRDLQSELKKAGQPWEKAKGFDGSCPLSQFISPELCPELAEISFSLEKNGEIMQQGDSGNMLNSITALLSYISDFFTLQPGDVVLTGTPAGVGPLRLDDQLSLSLQDQLHVTVVVK